MVCEFGGKLYFAGMGNPTATLVEVDPATNEARIAYYNIRYTRGVSNGVHGLLVYDGEILMCLATDNYDGNKTPSGIIVASSNPGADLDSWRVIADQNDFDGLPAVMQVDGLNGGGIWDIIEYNGYLYVTVVTDKSIDGKINKQGFAMYRGEKKADGSFTWTQVVGENGTSTLSRWAVRTITPISPTAPSATSARALAITPTSMSGAWACTTANSTSAPMTPPR